MLYHYSHQMIKRRIAAFEQEHGEIPIEENDR